MKSHLVTPHLGILIGVLTLSVGLFSCTRHQCDTHHPGSEGASGDHSSIAGHSWSYSGATGPEHWGELKPEYAACKAGHNQSPIDLTGAVVADLPALVFDYRPTELDLINNGHTLQLDHASGSTVTIDNRVYKLVQFHFHGPSEHIVDGSEHAMEAHLVHQSDDGQLTVLGILMDLGQSNPFIKTLWDVKPTHGERTTMEHVKINVMDLLPADKSYFKYSGSLTTPPCTEGVNWIVFKTPVSVSSEQVKRFKDVFELSARPVQAMHSRSVLSSR